MKVEEKSVCFLPLDAKYKSGLNYSINITFQHENNLTLFCAQNYYPHLGKVDHTTGV